MPDFRILMNELTNDPLGRGYAGMTHQQVADSLNAVNRDRWVQLSSADIFEAIVIADFTALSTANKARVDRILGLGDNIRTGPGSQARTELVAVFGAGSTTIANLAAVANRRVSRASEIGWADGDVGFSDIVRARALLQGT